MNLDREKSPHQGEHSKKKGCCCGGHNASNAKKSLTHHSTRSRLQVRRERKFVSEPPSEYDQYVHAWETRS